MQKVVLPIFLSFLSLFMASPLMAAEYTWEGSVDGLWSNPLNWSPNGVPGVQDSVIVTGSVALSLDADTEVASLKVEPSYESTLSLGDKTLIVNTGDFNAKSGGVDAGTSTIRFTGSSDQKFEHNHSAEYHIIFNDKTGGALKYSSWQVLSLDTIKASAGTTTELSRVGRVWVNHLDIQGTQANRSVLRSGAAGERIIVHVLKGDGQTVSYTDIRDCWADSGYGLAIDASEGGYDGGNNKGVSFDYPLAYWTGAGVDTNFSTADNWADSNLPTSNSILLFSRLMTNKDITFNQDVTIAGFKTMTWNYYGTIDFGSSTTTITGWVEEGPGNGLNATNATLRFAGAGDQTINFNSPVTAAEIVITDGNRFVEFNDSLDVETLDIQGSEVRFAADSTVTVDNATIIGATNPINLRPGNDFAGTMNTPWNFVVNNSATVSNARVRGSNADGGLTVAATQTEDQGLNTNWTFDGALPFGSDSVIEFPETSAVSPAFVEGDYYFNARSIVAEAHGGSVNGQGLSDSGFFLNLPLDPAGEETAVSVTFNNEELTKKEGEITWTATTLNAGGLITIRKGDSLLFTYNDGISANFRIDIDADGVYGDTVATGSLLPTQFNEAGVIEVSVQADPNGSLDQNGEIIFEEVVIYTVTVVDVDLRAPIAVEVGFERGKNIVIEPASEISSISFESSDEEVVEVRLHEERADGVRLSLTGMKRGFSSVISRLPNGQIVSALELDEFVLTNSGAGGYFTDITTGETEVSMKMTPYIPGLMFEMALSGSFNTFPDGDTESGHTSEDFVLSVNENGETVGTYNYIIISPPEASIVCHGVSVFQGEDDLEAVNDRWTNGIKCSFELNITKDTVCPGGTLKGTLKLIGPEDDGKEPVESTLFTVSFEGLSETIEAECKEGDEITTDIDLAIAKDHDSTVEIDIRAKSALQDKTWPDEYKVAKVSRVSHAATAFCIGDENAFTAVLEGDVSLPSDCDISWEIDGDIAEFTDESPTLTKAKFNGSGKDVIIRAFAGDQEKGGESDKLTIIGISEISADKTIVKKGGSITFTAEPDPEDAESIPGNSIEWEFKDIGNGGSFSAFDPAETGPSISPPLNAVGVYKVRARCGEDEWVESVEITVMEVQGLKAKDTNTKAEGARASNSRLVMVNDDRDRISEISILTNPSDITFPSGYPKWSGTNVTGNDGSLTGRYRGVTDSTVSVQIAPGCTETIGIDIVEEEKGDIKISTKVFEAKGKAWDKAVKRIFGDKAKFSFKGSFTGEDKYVDFYNDGSKKGYYIDLSGAVTATLNGARLEKSFRPVNFPIGKITLFLDLKKLSGTIAGSLTQDESKAVSRDISIKLTGATTMSAGVAASVGFCFEAGIEGSASTGLSLSGEVTKEGNKVYLQSEFKGDPLVVQVKFFVEKDFFGTWRCEKRITKYDFDSRISVKSDKYLILTTK